MAKAQPITVGVIGLGRIGWDYHAKTLKDNPKFKITACVDLLAERRKEAEDLLGCQTFATAEEFFAARPAELAVICTRSIDHCPHTLAAIKAGMHVVVEKPFAMNVREADRMIKAAEKAGKVLTINQSYRRNNLFRFVRETIDSGILGKVFWIRTSQHSFFRRNDWQQLKKYGGGFLNNNGAHAVDAAMLLLDSPVKDIWGDLKHVATAGDADDFVKVVLRGDNGRVVEVEQSYGFAFAQPAVLVGGTAGSMQVVGKEAQVKFFDPKKVKPIKIVDAAPEGRRYGNDDKLPWQELTLPVTPKKKYVDFFDNVAAAIRKGAKLQVTPESVREQIRVLDAVRKCANWTC